MKTVKFLMRQSGEFVSTPRNIDSPFVGQDYDKTKMADTIRSNDDWRPEPKLMYAIEEIEIPEWMSPDDFSEHNWTWYKRIGGTEELGKSVYDKIIGIKNGTLRLACMKLLNTKKFRSSFRESLKNQLVAWIQDINPKFKEPFSIKQQHSLCNEYTYQEARQIGVA